MGYSPGGLMYVSTTPVTINTQTPTSVFPSGSAAARTIKANSSAAGKSYEAKGGGIYTVPTGNLLSADITLKVGSATIVAVTTPAAPVGTNAGIDFKCTFTVQPGGATMICTGFFVFTVLGSTPVIVPFNSVTAKAFDPTVDNVVDVLGDWNGTVSTHSCTVQTASITQLN